MDLKLISKSEDKATILLTDSNPVIANTLRRLMMDEVPVLAIEDCEFIKNDSALYDEIISHRLGLIPLKTDLKSYNLKEDCKCKGKGCSICEVHLSLRAKGPAIVTSSELKAKDAKVKPVFPDMPIVKLLKGQKLEVDMKAVLGKGKTHTKWSPCLVYYRYSPILNVSNVKNAAKAKESCPKNVFEVKNDKLIVKNMEACDLSEDCVKYGVDVKYKEDEIMMFIESWGQLKIKDILSNGIEVFEEKLKELDKKIKD
ncbi:DNA-directed RNA polymerase subunit D [Candidatus Woesearchaeota archaeon]|nr:DNA-directed RNA polymerase subunit D [Candidatus Woesearchaeota archaeon]